VLIRLPKTRHLARSSAPGDLVAFLDAGAYTLDQFTPNNGRLRPEVGLIATDGSYDIPEGVIYGYPVTLKGGEYQVVRGIEISEFSRKRMDATLKELHEERDGVKHLLGK